MSTYNETRINLQTVRYDKVTPTPENTTGIVPVTVMAVDPETQEPTEVYVTEVAANITEKKANATILEFRTLGLPDPEIMKIQTFQYSAVGEVTPTEDLIRLLSGYNSDPAQVTKVAAALINRGLVLAQQNYGRDFMNDTDQPPVEGIYDLMIDASKPGEGRRKADPASRIVKALSELLNQSITADDLATMLASFKQQASPVGAQ